MTQQFVMKKGLVLGKPIGSKDAVSHDHLSLVLPEIPIPALYSPG
jgi:hypothetical protein